MLTCTVSVMTSSDEFVVLQDARGVATPATANPAWRSTASATPVHSALLVHVTGKPAQASARPASSRCVAASSISGRQSAAWTRCSRLYPCEVLASGTQHLSEAACHPSAGQSTMSVGSPPSLALTWPPAVILTTLWEHCCIQCKLSASGCLIENFRPALTFRFATSVIPAGSVLQKILLSCQHSCVQLP